MILFGGPVFCRSDDPYELADAHRRMGYRAAYCPAIDPQDAAGIRDARDAFAGAGIVLAEANAWGNLLAADPARQAANLDRVCRQLALADEIGALCTVDYLGTVDPHSEYGPHPDNLTDALFDRAVQTAREVLDAVKPRRAKFAFEMMQWVMPDSADCYARLLAAVDRLQFAVHLDPVNIVVTPRQYFNTAALIRECFGKLGPHIVSCHAKDLVLRNQLALHLDEVRPGLGRLDYRVYLEELLRLGRDVPLMLEHLGTAGEYADALAHLKSIERDVLQT